MKRPVLPRDYLKMRCTPVFSNTDLLIQDEIQNIDDLFDKYTVLIELVRQKEPDSIESLALAALVHSFYNGVENIFLLISKRIDSYTPNTFAWHTELLIRMGEETDKRKAVLQRTTLSDLQEYLGFRHFFRHCYSYHIDWLKLKPLVDNMQSTWDKVKNELEIFIKK